jgi:hypothetical protein
MPNGKFKRRRVPRPQETASVLGARRASQPSQMANRKFLQFFQPHSLGFPLGVQDWNHRPRRSVLDSVTQRDRALDTSPVVQLIGQLGLTLFQLSQSVSQLCARWVCSLRARDRAWRSSASGRFFVPSAARGPLGISGRLLRAPFGRGRSRRLTSGSVVIRL